jgi:hypothetical protein
LIKKNGHCPNSAFDANIYKVHRTSWKKKEKNEVKVVLDTPQGPLLGTKIKKIPTSLLSSEKNREVQGHAPFNMGSYGG